MSDAGGSVALACTACGTALRSNAKFCDECGAGVSTNTTPAEGNRIYLGALIASLVEALLQRGTDVDIGEAHNAIEQLAAVRTEPGFVLYDIVLLRLRALLARTRGDEAAYSRFVDRYLKMAISLGFEGHIAAAEMMLGTRSGR